MKRKEYMKRKETYAEVDARYNQLMREGKVMTPKEWYAAEDYEPTLEEEKAYWDSAPEELKKMIVNPYEKEHAAH